MQNSFFVGGCSNIAKGANSCFNHNHFKQKKKNQTPTNKNPPNQHNCKIQILQKRTFAGLIAH